MIAVGLISGGLDSAIATYLIWEQGYEIKAINIDTGFISEDKEVLQKLAHRFNMEIININVFEAYKKLLIDPPHGFGKNMNPCIDCRLIMYNEAKKIMEKLNADFVFTGEVLGQRPFSQNYNTLKFLEKETGLSGKLLRPLSAIYFSPTRAELEGKIDRSKLLAIKGRNRKIQLKLAEMWNLTEFNSPAGGCLLTDPGFSRRLRDWIRNEGRKTPINRNVVELLKLGRHIRLSPECRLVVGRNEGENRRIEKLEDMGYFLKVSGIPGPSALLLGDCEGKLEKAAAIVARYSDAKHMEDVYVLVKKAGSTQKLKIKVDKKIKYHMIM